MEDYETRLAQELRIRFNASDSIAGKIAESAARYREDTGSDLPVDELLNRMEKRTHHKTARTKFNNVIGHLWGPGYDTTTPGEENPYIIEE